MHYQPGTVALLLTVLALVGTHSHVRAAPQFLGPLDGDDYFGEITDDRVRRRMPINNLYHMSQGHLIPTNKFSSNNLFKRSDKNPEFQMKRMYVARIGKRQVYRARIG